MDADRLLPLLLGAIFGAAGWLFVGLYIQRRAGERAARNAARAVYFELAMDQVDIDVALRHAVYGTLRRDAFDRLLPELAMWLEVDELQTIARAYMSHSGYDQLQRDATIPGPVRSALLERIAAEHRAASDLLRARAFSRREAERLRTSNAEIVGARTVEREADARQRT